MAMLARMIMVVKQVVVAVVIALMGVRTISGVCMGKSTTHSYMFRNNYKGNFMD